jgi:hypothetical protein
VTDSKLKARSYSFRSDPGDRSRPGLRCFSDRGPARANPSAANISRGRAIAFRAPSTVFQCCNVISRNAASLQPGIVNGVVDGP